VALATTATHPQVMKLAPIPGNFLKQQQPMGLSEHLNIDKHSSGWWF
jgi:hypothetical protein